MRSRGFRASTRRCIPAPALCVLYSPRLDARAHLHVYANTLNGLFNIAMLFITRVLVVHTDTFKIYSFHFTISFVVLVELLAAANIR